MRFNKHITIGIDATNLRSGGGLTHLIELLRVAEPGSAGISRVILWGGRLTLNAVDDRSWLEKCSPSALNGGLLQRALWQRFILSRAAVAAGCDVLFVPGGSYVGTFHPAVTMSRNMLPFESKELKRYGWTLFTLKLLILRVIQEYSYRKVDGLIFLTEYARTAILKTVGDLNANICTIPHGINPRFHREPKSQRSIADYSNDNPYRILYVSTIDQYKHQWFVVEAIAALREKGFPVALDLVGAAFPPALKRLKSVMKGLPDCGHWIQYHGETPFNELHLHYSRADLGLFASSCENMPNILLETMAAGLPIACSNKGPMPEVLGFGGIYFDPEKPAEIALALSDLLNSPKLRTELSRLSYEQSTRYSWRDCAEKTFNFLASSFYKK